MNTEQKWKNLSGQIAKILSTVDGLLDTEPRKGRIKEMLYALDEEIKLALRDQFVGKNQKKLF